MGDFWVTYEDGEVIGALMKASHPTIEIRNLYYGEPEEDPGDQWCLVNHETTLEVSVRMTKAEVVALVEAL